MLKEKKCELKREVYYCMFAFQSKETQDSRHNKPKSIQSTEQVGWLEKKLGHKLTWFKPDKQGFSYSSTHTTSKAWPATPTWAWEQRGIQAEIKQIRMWGEAAKLIFTGDLNHNSGQVTFYIFSPLFLFNLWK